MVRLKRLFGEDDPARNRSKARSDISNARKLKSGGKHDKAAKRIWQAIERLRGLETLEDRELRAMCFLELSELTIYLEGVPAHPPLSKKAAVDCLALTDLAEKELEPILTSESPTYVALNQWYPFQNPWFPRGLIEFRRGAALHLSSRYMDDDLDRAIAHYQEALRYLDARSDDAAQAREMLGDAESSLKLRQLAGDLPPLPPDAQQFVDNLASRVAAIEFENQRRKQD